ncbi:chitin deacetylase, partial [Cladochytrium tenue]
APDFQALGFPSGASHFDPSDGFYHPDLPPVIGLWTEAIKEIGAAAGVPIPDTQLASNFTPWAWNSSFDITNCPKNVWTIAVDDGPRGFTPQFLTMLSNYSAPGTFFILGGNLVYNSSWATDVRAAFDAGHQIGSHRHLTTETTDEAISEFIWDALAVKQVIGKVPRYIRPPYGDVDPRIRGILATFGFYEVMWNVNTDDTAIPSGSGDLLTYPPGPTVNLTNTFTIINATAIINATLKDGIAATGLTFLPNTGGYIPLTHELEEEQVYLLRSELDAVAKSGFAFKSVAYCHTNGAADDDSQRYFPDSHPFVMFLDSITFPINVTALQAASAAASSTKSSSATAASVTGSATTRTGSSTSSARPDSRPDGVVHLLVQAAWCILTFTAAAAFAT